MCVRVRFDGRRKRNKKPQQKTTSQRSLEISPHHTEERRTNELTVHTSDLVQCSNQTVWSICPLRWFGLAWLGFVPFALVSKYGVFTQRCRAHWHCVLLCFRFVGCFMFYSYFCTLLLVMLPLLLCDADAVALHPHSCVCVLTGKSPCRSLVHSADSFRIARSLTERWTSLRTHRWQLFTVYRYEHSYTRCVNKMRLAHSHSISPSFWLFFPAALG